MKIKMFLSLIAVLFLGISMASAEIIGFDIRYEITECQSIPEVYECPEEFPNEFIAELEIDNDPSEFKPGGKPPWISYTASYTTSDDNNAGEWKFPGSDTTQGEQTVLVLGNDLCAFTDAFIDGIVVDDVDPFDNDVNEKKRIVHSPVNGTFEIITEVADFGDIVLFSGIQTLTPKVPCVVDTCPVSDGEEETVSVIEFDASAMGLVGLGTATLETKRDSNGNEIFEYRGTTGDSVASALDYQLFDTITTHINAAGSVCQSRHKKIVKTQNGQEKDREDKVTTFADDGTIKVEDKILNTERTFDPFTPSERYEDILSATDKIRKANLGVNDAPLEIHVFHETKFYKAIIDRKDDETIETPLGQFNTQLFEITVKTEVTGETKVIFMLNLTDDEEKNPLKIDVDFPVIPGRGHNITMLEGEIVKDIDVDPDSSLFAIVGDAFVSIGYKAEVRSQTGLANVASNGWLWAGISSRLEENVQAIKHMILLNQVEVLKNITSNSYLTLGRGAVVIGNGNSKKAFLGPRSVIMGDLTVSDSVHLNNTASVLGDITEGGDPVEATVVELPTCEVTAPDGDNLKTRPGRTHEVTPGNHGHYSFGSHNEVSFPTGDYSFKSLKFGPKTSITFEPPVVFHIEKNLVFGPRVKTSLTNGGEANKVIYRIGGSAESGAKSEIIGTICAPHNNVVLHNDSKLTGAIYGKGVIIGYKSIFKAAPANLADLDDLSP